MLDCQQSYCRDWSIRRPSSSFSSPANCIFPVTIKKVTTFLFFYGGGSGVCVCGGGGGGGGGVVSTISPDHFF